MSIERFLNDRVTLHCGDCLAVLPTLAENSIDSVVCDPPYHLTSIVKRFGSINSKTDKAAHANGPHGRMLRGAAGGFMNAHWDGGDIAFQVNTWDKVFRVMKPGAYLIAFSSTRTFGRMQVACEDAGFITHPLIAWIFGQGFPKATRVKHDDWEGWRYGTQSLKPAIEPIYVGQKPFEKGLSGTENIIKWGCGALNIDGCRIKFASDADYAEAFEKNQHADFGTGPRNNSIYGTDNQPRRNYAPRRRDGGSWGASNATCKPTFNASPEQHDYRSAPHDAGRWPANVIHDGSEEVLAKFPQADSTRASGNPNNPRHGSKDRVATSYDWNPERESNDYRDTGSAARFFYSSKADSDDRLGSKHPTVKPLDLIQYLVRLVTPPKGTVLDCFAGTGTTGEAAWREGFSAVLIEREAEYQADIRRRMALALSGPDERARESLKQKLKGKPLDPGPLFGGDKYRRPEAPDDFAKSLEVAYDSIRERVANGGERGWMEEQKP